MLLSDCVILRPLSPGLGLWNLCASQACVSGGWGLNSRYRFPHRLLVSGPPSHGSPYGAANLHALMTATSHYVVLGCCVLLTLFLAFLVLSSIAPTTGLKAVVGGRPRGTLVLRDSDHSTDPLGPARAADPSPGPAPRPAPQPPPSVAVPADAPPKNGTRAAVSASSEPVGSGHARSRRFLNKLEELGYAVFSEEVIWPCVPLHPTG